MERGSNKRVFMKVILTAFMLLMFFSCGMTEDDKVSSEVYDIGELETNCKLNGDNFHNILKSDIRADINCLGDSLEQFADMVRRKDPKYINRQELETFINRFFAEDAGDIVKILRPAFKVSGLLLKDPQENLSVDKVPLLVEIVHTINQQGRAFSDLLQIVVEKAPEDRDETDDEREARIERNAKRYWQHKDELLRVVRALVGRIVDVISVYAPINSSIDVPEVLEELKEGLELGDEFDIETITSFLFVKKLIIGGDSFQLYDKEVTALLNKAPELLSVAMDALFLSGRPAVVGSDTVVDIDKSRFMMELVKRARRMFFNWSNPNELILDFNQLIDVLNKVMEDVDWDRASDSLLNFKEKIIGGDRQNYTFGDVDRLLNMVQEASEIYFFNYITYHHFSRVMESEEPVVGILRPNLPEYAQFTSARLNEMWTNFAFVAKNYHLFMDKDSYSTIGFKIRRHAYGFNLNSLFRWALQKFFVAYGRIVTTESSGEFVLDLEDTRLITSHYKGVLEELELWPDDLERLLSELRLGSDLFRMNSNGDNFIQLDEITELATVLISTSKIKKNVLDRMKLHCANQSGDPEEPTFVLDCFHENFFNVLFRELDHYKQLPNMHHYFLSRTQEQLTEFLIAVEVKARIVNEPSLPIDGTDIGRILTNMYNYETLYKRYDADQNFLIKGDELDGVYSLVENTIVSASNGSLKPGSGLAKSTYLFVIKKGRLPHNENGETTLKGKIELLAFHVNPLAKLGIEANRLTIAIVLGNF